VTRANEQVILQRIPHALAIRARKDSVRVSDPGATLAGLLGIACR
jgi:hypothetical protein